MAVERLAGQVERWRRALAAVLGLAGDLQNATIEMPLCKSEEELDVEVLPDQEPTAADGGRAE